MEDLSNLNNINAGLVPPPKFGYNPARNMDTLSDYFNISRFSDWNNMPVGYFGHIIMTRPDLNLPFKSTKILSDTTTATATANKASISTIGEMCRYVLDDELYRHISRLSRYASNPYLPIVYNRAKSYSTMEYELNTVDSNPTFFGHTMKYGVRSEDHKKAKQITIDFRNDRFLSIYHLFNFWELYIKYISNTNFIIPNPSDEMYGALDYYGAIYYLVTKRDMSEVVYWEKLMVMPTKVSTAAMFDYVDGIMPPVDTITVEFQATLAGDPMDPEILQDINNLTFPRNPDKANRASTIASGRTVSRDDYFNPESSITYINPFITSSKNSDGRIVSKLLWL